MPCLPLEFSVLDVQKNAPSLVGEGAEKGRRPTFPRVTVVSLASVGLTALFGMGRGDPYRFSHLNLIVLKSYLQNAMLYIRLFFGQGGINYQR